MKVSIHALRVEGDGGCRGADRDRPGFNPRPPRGGRRCAGLQLSGRDACFNPRPRVGGDLAASVLVRIATRVSIHAPAWGATGRSAPGCVVPLFQSTPPRGGRPRSIADAICSASVFQSTPPRGGRPSDASAERAAPMAFQSTPPRGGRHTVDQPRIGIVTVSIHAPAWGATRRQRR